MPVVDMTLEELKKYKPQLYREADFDDFWKRTLDESARYPLNETVTKIDYPANDIEVFEVWYNGFKNGRVCGTMIYPNKVGKLPGILHVHGYGLSKEPVFNLLPFAQAGYAVLSIDVRGQSGKSIDGNVYTNGHAIGFMTLGLNSPDDYYYRYVYMDCVRAVDVLAKQDRINASRIAILGMSQGGGITLAVGALDKRAKCLSSQMPYLTNFPRSIDIASAGPYLEFIQYLSFHPDKYDSMIKTLSYFDTINLACNITAPTLMTVGLQDTVCPPSAVYSAYNYLTCAKEITIYRAHGHAEIHSHREKELLWFKQNL